MHWKCGHFSHLGKSHESDAVENHDSYLSLVRGGACILVVSDGAGSAEKAKFGSEALISSFRSSLEDCDSSLFESPVQKIDSILILVKDAIERARLNLMKPKTLLSLFANTSQSSIHDYAATLVMVISSGHESAIFHIGDGYAGVANFDETLSLERQFLSLPRNGQFDNETFFFTDDNWSSNLRVTLLNSEVNYVFAMSDGADPFMIAPSRDKLDERINSQLYSLLGGESPPALEDVFTKEKVHAVSHDDATLLVGRL